jgi:4a-hydroxytetrahydrobiopterin dehydratase
MGGLAKEKCVPCRSGEPALAEQQVRELHVQVPEWQVIEVDGIQRLERVFKFKDFVDAMGFTTRIALLAQAEDHHPRLVTEWGRVEVQWWTHAVKGLHKNDFIMAAKTDAIYG